MSWVKPEYDKAVTKRVKELAEKDMTKAINHKDKAGRAAQLKAVRQAAMATIATEFPDKIKDAEHEFEEIEYRVMRAQVLDKGERIDGRDLETVRPISIEAGWLPRVHGSALFTRGQTQALVAVTLGTSDDEQRIDSIDVPGESTKSFMLHYNFPPYSTGEVRPPRHQPPGDRPRCVGGAGPPGPAARLRCLPLHPARRLRDP